MQAGDCGEYAWKIEGYENRVYNTNSDEYDNEPIMKPDNAMITIFDSDGYYFNWTSDQPVCTVIVKDEKEQRSMNMINHMAIMN